MHMCSCCHVITISILLPASAHFSHMCTLTLQFQFHSPPTNLSACSFNIALVYPLLVYAIVAFIFVITRLVTSPTIEIWQRLANK